MLFTAIFMWAYFSGSPTESIGTTAQPNVVSMIILSAPRMIRSMLSKYMRLRVTSGAFLYPYRPLRIGPFGPKPRPRIVHDRQARAADALTFTARLGNNTI